MFKQIGAERKLSELVQGTVACGQERSLTREHVEGTLGP